MNRELSYNEWIQYLRIQTNKMPKERFDWYKKEIKRLAEIDKKTTIKISNQFKNNK
tara:strand:- start:127 stop:294 length:168 start_codon:yes stop_codon:yes gene_type:complete